VAQPPAEVMDLNKRCSGDPCHGGQASRTTVRCRTACAGAPRWPGRRV